MIITVKDMTDQTIGVKEAGVEKGHPIDFRIMIADLGGQTNMSVGLNLLDIKESPEKNIISIGMALVSPSDRGMTDLRKDIIISAGMMITSRDALPGTGARVMMTTIGEMSETGAPIMITTQRTDLGLETDLTEIGTAVKIEAADQERKGQGMAVVLKDKERVTAPQMTISNQHILQHQDVQDMEEALHIQGEKNNSFRKGACHKTLAYSLTGMRE